MLVILVGTTLTVAKNSREHFKKRGYSVIEKYTFRPDESVFSPISPPTMHAEEEVKACDFVYAIHGGRTGFYKAQIMDAVRGRCNALITMSPDNFDFVREIIASFGEYVIPVFLYIDEKSLETLTRTYIKEEDNVQMRLATGRTLRQLYLENISLFEKTVLFSTNDDFDMDALYAQYDMIIDKADAIQKKLNERLYVELPYTGNQDYIFVSYSHKDERQVLPYLSALQREGYRIWYDEGINKGANWSVMLGERLQGCTDFLLFSSENSAASERVEDEVNGAKMCGNIHPITVRLDDAKFPFGYEMFLSKYQNIFVRDGGGIEQIKSALRPSTRMLREEESANFDTET
ncbi:MAG: toll/interleukin-1 receptor domain-containing protein [Ruminococcaceae bacterium]|nr:toll/interleukin-1 receptor domain-containing protein [Oscillospiraceae bacterium]